MWLFLWDKMDENKLKVLTRFRSDLIGFGRFISPSTFWAGTPQFHYELAEVINNRDNKKICIQAPRGSAKSSLIRILALHHAIYDEGDKVIVIQSKTLREAKRKLSKIKEILEYEKTFIDLYGYCGEKVAEAWREDYVRTRIGKHRVSIITAGTGQMVRGILEGDTRITLYILDDPDSEDNTKTKEAMQDNFDKFWGGLAGLDPRTGRAVVIGTPITQGCIVERLMGRDDDSTDAEDIKSTDEWIVKRYELHDDDFKNLLWEEIYPEDRCRAMFESHKKRLMTYKYYSEYRCLVRGREDQLFKSEYFNYYDGKLEFQGNEAYLKITEENGVRVDKKIPVNTFIGIDPASSQKQTADYTVIFPIAYSADNQIYCLPYFRDQISPMETALKIADYIQMVKPLRGGIETTNYQEALREMVKAELEKRNLYCAGFEQTDGFKPRDEKNKRLERLHGFFYQRQVWIMKEGMGSFTGELFMYPKGNHEDTLDGFDYATRRMYAPDHEVRSNVDLLNRDFWGKSLQPTWMSN